MKITRYIKKETVYTLLGVCVGMAVSVGLYSNREAKKEVIPEEQPKEIVCETVVLDPTETPVIFELTEESEEIEEPINVKKEYAEDELKSLGFYKLTAYCPCEKCCGKSNGITATGAVATPDHTIAVDPMVIPYGTKVLINGQEYVAEDCGGSVKGNVIDIFFTTHEEAINFGISEAEVFMIME